MKSIIKYCLGSNKFRQLHEQSFLKSISQIEPLKLSKLLNELHIFAIFYSYLTDNNTKQFNKYFRPFLLYQSLWNQIISQEIRTFKNFVRHDSLIILKGPSFWKNIYHKNYLRRVEDIDLLIEGHNSIDEACSLLINNGYICDYDYRSYIINNNVYELPEFYKKILIKTNERQSELLNFVFNNYNPLFFEKHDFHSYSFNCRVEIHKLLFKFRKRITFEPHVSYDMLSKSNIFENCYALENYACLPYLSLKFISDSQDFMSGDNGKAKCVKLFIDFVRILETTSNSDVAKSIKVAEEWQITDFYIEMLNNAKEYIPEINLYGIPKTDSKIIENFIDHFCSIKK